MGSRPLKPRLQSLALRLRAIPFVPALYLAWYQLAILAVVRLSRRMPGAVKAVYLRRGGGRGELVPCASDLDFFLVLAALPAEREMELLKGFWRSYFRLRILFPFLGEVLMGEEIELRQWLESPTVRAREAASSWRLLAGVEEPGLMEAVAEPEIRDVLSEALKCYWEQLECVVKLRDSDFHAGLRPFDAGTVRLRNAAKATLDLFRLHHLLSLSTEERTVFWDATREELISLLPAAKYGDDLELLRPLLTLSGSPFGRIPPFELFSSLLHRSLGCLHEISAELTKNTLEESEQGWTFVRREDFHDAGQAQIDRYSLSVRELFAERVLLRHQSFLARALLSETSTHLFFLLRRLPSLPELRELLADLRDVSFSFDRFSLAMPLTEAAFAELERTSVFDTPFHAFLGHRECRLGEDGAPVTRPWSPSSAVLPSRMIAKTFAELSFVLRYPPARLDYFLEKMLGLVLGLRVASEQKEIVPGFRAAWARYGQSYPERAAQIAERLGPCLDRKESGQSPTDLWINLTPFLRMEMAALKERFFRHRGRLKV